ncbi:uncharacterized protein N7518_001483 [Penicillium psychrosexuale]|uniref:uncharacterized protein n=1 Tax=Penicillium psychrosexuale TaxID=1002107 RepID=UPI0025452658|nr:uncharacterized protein N7518_001483 [Penicillium psychrosexuale]KAJ5799415.1 hypothetical protein N7518_001483 [Penicillium psychrosexuale]
MGDILPLELEGNDTSETASGAEHCCARNTATTSTTVFIRISRDSKLPSSAYCIPEEPLKLAPCTPNLDEAFELRMMPCQIAPASTDMGNEEMVICLVRIRAVYFVQWPSPGDEVLGTMLGPFKRTGNVPLAIEGEFGRVCSGIGQEDNIVVSSCCRVSAPFGPWENDKLARLIERCD